jgi:hypothetical protein
MARGQRRAGCARITGPFVAQMHLLALHLDELRWRLGPARGELAHWLVRRPRGHQARPAKEHHSTQQQPGRLVKQLHGAGLYRPGSTPSKHKAVDSSGTSHDLSTRPARPARLFLLTLHRNSPPPTGAYSVQVLENRQEKRLVHRKGGALLLRLCRSNTYRRTNKDNPDRKKTP